MLNTFTMCRDPKEFDKPDEFIPERWLRNEVREFSPFTSLPFGFGARSCVGRRVAETMVYLSIANVSSRKLSFMGITENDIVRKNVNLKNTKGLTPLIFDIHPDRD